MTEAIDQLIKIVRSLILHIRSVIVLLFSVFAVRLVGSSGGHAVYRTVVQLLRRQKLLAILIRQ